MNWPSATLLAQSVLSGVFVGALYGLLGLGLSLSWGLLKLINLAHFGFAFLAAYLCYQMASMGVDPLHALVALLAAGAVALAMARWLRVRLGGYTGDTLGATQQGAELAIYLALLAARTHA